MENTSSFTIVQGDPVSFPGTIPSGNISEMRVWLFGSNSTSVATVPVQQYSPFLFRLAENQTSAMINGTYRILFEFPSPQNTYSLTIASVGTLNDTVLYDHTGSRILDFSDVNDNQISGLHAAAAVEQAIRETGTENVTGITLYVEEPEITIDPIPDHVLGDTVTFGGTTNLDPGETLTVQIYDADFHPCAKCQVISNDSVESCCGSFARPVIVIPGNCGANTWSLDVNTSYHDFQGGEPYLVIVSGRDGLAMNECLFNILAVQKPDPFHYVTISQPVTNPGENALRLSGSASTDFGPQEKFLLQISSGSNATLITVVPVVFDGTGYSWNYTVDLSALSAHGLYEVNITSLNNPEIRNSSTFTV
jgi:hypothetical protein